jgi:hypothetical protein
MGEETNTEVVAERGWFKCYLESTSEGNYGIRLVFHCENKSVVTTARLGFKNGNFGKIKAVFRACGFDRVYDTDNIMHIPFMAIIQPADYQGKLYNEFAPPSEKDPTSFPIMTIEAYNAAVAKKTGQPTVGSTAQKPAVVDVPKPSAPPVTFTETEGDDIPF